MATTVSTVARNAAVNAVAALVDAGPAAGLLRVYTGAQPASPDTGPTGTLLATFTLNDPAFAAASIGSAALDVDPALTTTAVASGTAGYFRMLDSTGVAIMDGAVGTTGAQLNLNTTIITNGGTVSIVSGSLTQPGT